MQSAKTRPRTDFGSDHELYIAKFRIKLNKLVETTRPFRYDLNQILYGYTVEVRSRFKGLDLIKCMMNYGWQFLRLYRRQESRPSPRKRNAKRQKVIWVGPTNSCEEKRRKKQRRKGKIYPFECRVQKNSKERQESPPQRSVQRNRAKQ